MDKLPESIVHIDVLRVNRGIEKRCKCEKPRNFIVDTENKCVNCGGCGALVDAYEAIAELADRYDRLHAQIEKLYEQRKQIVNYEPHLLVLRELDRRYRSKKELPVCPNCNRGFYIEEIPRFVDRGLEEHRRFTEKHSSK